MTGLIWALYSKNVKKREYKPFKPVKYDRV